MESSRERFKATQDQSAQEKKGGTIRDDRGIMEDAAKKAFLLRIQSWGSRRSIAEHLRISAGETEDRGDRKSHILKTKEPHQDMRRCEIYPTISGYTIGKRWDDAKAVYIIHGTSGCAIWFKRFGEISTTGRTWGLNEQGMPLEITRNEEEYRQLARRFGRYKRVRGEALETLKAEKAREGEPGQFITWGEVRERAPKWRSGNGYTSEEEEKRKHREKKGAESDRKGSGKGESGKREITEEKRTIQRKRRS